MLEGTSIPYAVVLLASMNSSVHGSLPGVQRTQQSQVDTAVARYAKHISSCTSARQHCSKLHCHFPRPLSGSVLSQAANNNTASFVA